MTNDEKKVTTIPYVEPKRVPITNELREFFKGRVRGSVRLNHGMYMTDKEREKYIKKGLKLKLPYSTKAKGER